MLCSVFPFLTFCDEILLDQHCLSFFQGRRNKYPLSIGANVSNSPFQLILGFVSTLDMIIVVLLLLLPLRALCFVCSGIICEIVQLPHFTSFLEVSARYKLWYLVVAVFSSQFRFPQFMSRIWLLVFRVLLQQLECQTLAS